MSDVGIARVANTIGQFWGWVELHWSDHISGNFKLGQYRCPTLNEYDLQNNIPNVTSLPSEYRNKSINDMMGNLQKSSATSSKEFNLNSALLQEHKKMVDGFKTGKVKELNHSYICSSVEQWVIVEIQPSLAVERGLFFSFPSFDVWAFLQPYGIGSSSRMKQERGYVSDDIPRAGWFQTSIQWFAEVVNANGQLKLVPKMSVHDDAGKIVQWRDVECCLTKETDPTKSPYSKNHPLKPGYGEGYRFLFRIPVVVENKETKYDRDRKRTAFDLFAKEKKLTHEQYNDLLRLEAGSYLKVWVRNSRMNWSSNFIPADDGTENCMRHMQLIDNSKKVPDMGKSVLAPFLTIGASSPKILKPHLYQSYIDYYYANGIDKTSVYNPLDIAYNKEMFRNAFVVNKNDLKPLKKWEAVVFPYTGPDIQLPPEPTESKTKTEENRYTADGDNFRPFSYRNHTWKRNNFSDDGTFKENEWHYVLLWPKEMIREIDLLAGKTFASPGQFNIFHFLGALFCYGLYVSATSRTLVMRKNQLKKKEKYKTKTEEQMEIIFGKDSLCQLLEIFIEKDEFRNLAGALSLYSFNAKNKQDEGFGIKEYIERFSTDSKGYGTAAYIDSFLQLYQMIIKTLIVDESNPKKIIQNIREAISPLLIQSASSARNYALNANSTIPSVSENSEDGTKTKVNTAPKKTYGDLYRQYKQKKAKAKEKGTYESVTVEEISLTDQKVTFEKELLSITKHLAAYPLPIPILSWIVFAMYVKISSKLGATVDASELFGEGHDRIKFSLDFAGDYDFHATLGALWTLYEQLDGEMKKKHIIGKPDDTPDNPLESFVTTALNIMGLELSANCKVNVTGKIPFEFSGGFESVKEFFSQFKNSEEKLSFVLSLQCSVTSKASVIATELFSFNMPIIAASPSAIAFFPSGVEIKTVGGFSASYLSDLCPWRIKLSNGRITQPIKGLNCQEIWAGKEFELKCSSIGIFPTDLLLSLKNIPFFEECLVSDANESEKLIPFSTNWKFEKHLIEAEGKTTICIGRSSFKISISDLYTSAEYGSFIKSLLLKDQKGKIKVSLAGDINEHAFWEPGPEKCKFKNAYIVTLRSPFISTLAINGKKDLHTFQDRIDIYIKTNYLNLDCKLFCFCYEVYEKLGYDNMGNDRIVKGKNGKLHYFPCYPIQDATYTYKIPIALSELVHIKMTDESSDPYWEFCFAFALDYDAKFLLRFEPTTIAYKESVFHSQMIRVKKII